MDVTGYIVPVGTASVPVVSMSADAQHVVIQNQESQSDTGAYARDGGMFLLHSEFTVNSPGTAMFSVLTGATGMQIEFYEIISTISNVRAELVEGATITTTGAAIPAYNLNRTVADSHDTVFTSASTVTGGSAVSAEYVTADKHAAGGGSTSGKIQTLEPSTEYAFKFINKGNQATTVFFQMGFVEKYNGYNDVYLGGEDGTSFRLRGGESVYLPMGQGQTLSAEALDSATVGVLKQD